MIVEYRLLDEAGQAASAASEVLIGVYNQNRNNRFDINQDQFVTPLDVLVAFNSMNLDGIRSILPGAGTAPFYDVNSDSLISPIDALHVINYLNLNGIGSGTTGGGGSSGEGEFSRDSQGGESAIDAHFGPLYQTLSVDNHAPQRSQLMHRVTTDRRENSELAFGNFVAEWANPTRSDEISARNLDWFSFENQSASKLVGRVSASLRSVSHELEQIFAELQATNETTWLE